MPGSARSTSTTSGNFCASRKAIDRPITPAPITTIGALCCAPLPVMGCADSISSGEPVAKGVRRVHKQRRFAGDKRTASDDWPQLVAAHLCRRFKNAAGNALLTPGFTGLDMSVLYQAGELGAGAGAARGAIVGTSRAEDKILAVGGF